MSVRGRPALPPVHPVYAAPAQFEEYGIRRAFEAASDRLRPMIERVAAALAGADDLFRQDLVQEGLVAIWDLDPSRFDEADEGYFRRAVAVRMRLAARRERVQAHRRRVSRKRVHQAMEAASPPHSGSAPARSSRGSSRTW